MTKTCAWIALALISGIASLTLAHGDERKLLDRIGPYEGTGWVASSGLRGGGGQFDRSGVELLSWLTLSDLGGSIDGNDCWGYVSPSGREYAIIGHGHGTSFVEITDPTNPVVIGNISGTRSIWRDIKIYQQHAYIVCEDGDGAYRVMRNAVRSAGIEPSDIAYINAHGTSTPLGDKIESQATERLFGDRASKIAVSSTKSMTGHLLGGAGGLEAGITALALRDQIVPPTINLTTPGEGDRKSVV